MGKVFAHVTGWCVTAELLSDPFGCQHFISRAIVSTGWTVSDSMNQGCHTLFLTRSQRIFVLIYSSLILANLSLTYLSSEVPD